MAAQPEVVRQSELINRPILDRVTQEDLGRVEVLWMYIPIHRVLGLIGKSGFLGKQKVAFKLAQIYSITDEEIVTQGSPEETDADRVHQLESPLNFEVWSQDGQKLGKVIDYLFDPQTGKITHYLLTPGSWSPVIDGIYQFTPKQIVSLDNQRISIKTPAKSLKLYREGIRQKFTEVTETIEDEYLDLTEGMQREVRSLTRQLRSVTGQAREQWQHLTGQTKEQAQTLAEQAREKAQQFNERFKEEGQTLVEQAKEKSQTWLERLKEQTQGFNDFIEEQAQTIQDQIRSQRYSDVDQTIDVKPLEVIALPPSEPTQRTRKMPQARSVVFEDEDPWDTPVLPNPSALPTSNQPSVIQPTGNAIEQQNAVASEDDDEPWI